MLIDPCELVGAWWLPDDETSEISGTLKFAPAEGITLDLIGSFRGLADPDAGEPIPVVHGYAGGKEITLLNCLMIRSNLQAPGVHLSTLRPRIAYLGALFDHEDEIRFESVSVAFNHLNPWVDISGIEINRENGLSATISIRRPETIRNHLPDGSGLDIAFSQQGPSWHLGRPETSVSQQAHIRFSTHEPRPYSEFQQMSYHFQHFLSLAVGRSCPPILVQCSLPEADGEAGEHGGRPSLVEAIFRPLEAADLSSHLIPQQMLFPYSMIAERFGNMMLQWYSAEEHMRAVYNLYFATRYSSRMFLENRFLNLVQALESYHRLSVGGTRLPVEEFQALVEAIVASVTEEHGEWLRSQLRYSNEKRLYERLTELSDLYSPLVIAMVGARRESFLRRVVDSRNYLIHYDPDLRAAAASGADLLHISRQLRMIMEACILTEIGFDPGESQEMLQERADYFAW